MCGWCPPSLAENNVWSAPVSCAFFTQAAKVKVMKEILTDKRYD